jgi:hypothetical protein
MTVRAEKSTRLPIKFPLNRPSFPFNLARMALIGHPNLQLDQVGVPKSIAMTLTYPERGKIGFAWVSNRKVDTLAHQVSS